MAANATPPTPPKRLLNHVVDDMARENPDALYAELLVAPPHTRTGGIFRDTVISRPE